RGASSGGVPRGTPSRGATRLRVAARGSAAAAISTPRSEHQNAPAMRVALVHDWLTGRRGGELVLAQLVRLFPDSEVFTLLRVPGSVGPDVESRPIHTSPLQSIPGVGHRYRTFLPLMPAAMRFLDLRGFDLVISSSHCLAT